MELQNPSQNLQEKGLRLKFYTEMQINFQLHFPLFPINVARQLIFANLLVINF